VNFAVSSPGPLRGEAKLPGDRTLTLWALALGMLSGGNITISNPSPSPDAGALIRFLREHGASLAATRAELSESPGSIALRGYPFQGPVTVPRDLPDKTALLIVAAAAFNASRILMEGRGLEDEFTAAVDSLVRPLCRNLEIHQEGGGLLIEGAEYAPREPVEVESSLELLAATAAAMSINVPLTFSCNTDRVSSALSLFSALGCGIKKLSHADDRDAELERRMARASGKKPRERFAIEWDSADCTIRIPVDTSIAAAVAAVSSASPGSDVLLREVLWETDRRGFFDALRRMKGNVEQTLNPEHGFITADIRMKQGELEGIHLTADQSESIGPDWAILAALASTSSGETIIRIPTAGSTRRDTSPRFLTRRVASTVQGLETLGAIVGEYPEGIVVKRGAELRGDMVDSDGSPDTALALTVAGMLASGTTTIFGHDGDSFPVGEFIKIVTKLQSDRVTK
jgi:3-phosphoshikimate 1-carboxyvinyltransferase